MSDSLREPIGVGPIAGGHLRASDSDRDQVATVLSTAYAEGRLTKEEHDERLDLVMAARTFDDLLPLTHDLVPLPTGPTGPSSGTAATPSYAIQPSAGPDTDTWVAVFGGVSRAHNWRVRRNIRAFAVFGGMDIDMREAIFEDKVIEISGMWVFGGLDIKIPAGLQVRDQTAGIFGGTDIRNVGEPQPGAPTLVIKGFTLFGGVSVHGPKPPKRREAVRR